MKPLGKGKGQGKELKGRRRFHSGLGIKQQSRSLSASYSRKRRGTIGAVVEADKAIVGRTGHLCFTGDPEIWTEANLDAILDALCGCLGATCRAYIPNVPALFAKALADVRDRKWHMRKYKNCFVAEDCVSVMLATFSLPSRVLAVKIGELLRQRGNLQHVVDANKPFMDKYHFFRLTLDISSAFASEEEPYTALSPRESSPRSVNTESSSSVRLKSSVGESSSLVKNRSPRSGEAPGHEGTSDSCTWGTTDKPAPASQARKQLSPVIRRSTTGSKISKQAPVPKADVLNYRPPQDVGAWLDENFAEVVGYLSMYLDVRNRKWHLRTYKKCFVTSDCVEVMCVGFGMLDRTHAVALGEKLREKGVVQHVVDHDKPFCDKYLYFRMKCEKDSSSTSLSTSELPTDDAIATSESSCSYIDRSASASSPAGFPRRGHNRKSSGKPGRDRIISISMNHDKRNVFVFSDCSDDSSSAPTSSLTDEDWVDPAWVRETSSPRPTKSAGASNLLGPDCSASAIAELLNSHSTSLSGSECSDTATRV